MYIYIKHVRCLCNSLCASILLMSQCSGTYEMSLHLHNCPPSLPLLNNHKNTTTNVNCQEISTTTTTTTTTFTTSNDAVTVCDKNLPYNMLWCVLFRCCLFISIIGMPSEYLCQIICPIF